MQDAVSSSTQREPRASKASTNAIEGLRARSFSSIRSLIEAPDLTSWGAAAATSILLVISFPPFNLWPLVFIALVPLLFVVGRRPVRRHAFLLGWLAGTIFFYASCHWLTYSMIHYGRIPAVVAYLLLIPGALILGLFPATFSFITAHSIKRWGLTALFFSPFLWPALEWLRLLITGQLWNAIGYSIAFQESLIQAARWGGVYAVGFVILIINAAIAFLLLKGSQTALMVSATALLIAAGLILSSHWLTKNGTVASTSSAIHVVAIQPNVPMHPVSSPEEMAALVQRHLSLSETGLRSLEDLDGPRLVIWPESPMNFAYAPDSQFREFMARFTISNNTSVIFNSLEPADDQGGVFNSALLVNEQGSLSAQYDKIRLMPFGEYVPLPHWLPGASLVTAIVGDFTAGDEYTLMNIGDTQAGVFICIESAYPFIAREFTRRGAQVLVNISNDGYLGPTAVMEQHLANAVFRAVENNRPILRVTNTGITALITPSGTVTDATEGFQQAVRTWTITDKNRPMTFYSRYGEIFPAFCAAFGLAIFAASFRKIRG